MQNGKKEQMLNVQQSLQGKNCTHSISLAKQLHPSLLPPNQTDGLMYCEITVDL